MTAPAWHEGWLCAFDNETTGVDVHNDRIVTASVIHLEPGKRPRVLSWLINPGIPVPDEAANVHGWTTERLTEQLAGREAQRTGNGVTRSITRAQALFEIAGQVALAISIRKPVVAFNAAYDLSIIEAECARNSVPTLTERLAPKPITGIVDPFVIDKHYSRRRGSRKLSDQVNHYKVILAGAHDAGADALAAARLVPRMIEAYPELRRMSLSKLHQSQIAWRAEQMDSLRAYFDRVGKEHDGCDPGWPLQSMRAPTEQAVLL